jgi:hypothetical protein
MRGYFCLKRLLSHQIRNTPPFQVDIRREALQAHFYLATKCLKAIQELIILPPLGALSKRLKFTAQHALNFPTSPPPSFDQRFILLLYALEMVQL